LYAGEKYCFTEWAEALKKFLGISIEVWAWENPTVWGNYKGANAFYPSFSPLFNVTGLS
jgi:hypothetical protein